MTARNVAPLARLDTGTPTLDGILGGGIPRESVVVMSGEPGAGKTVVTLQVLFHLAKQGKKCLYFTTLSEPAMKLIRYMQLFSFFDAGLLDEKIITVDLGSTLRLKGADAALAQLLERVEVEGAEVVAIDSFRAIHDFVGNGVAGGRSFVYNLSVQMAAWGATTFLVGEYAREHVLALPEFAVADGIIHLSAERRDLTTSREIEVLKLRGNDFLSGRHYFDIDAQGVVFYPRVTLPKRISEGSFSIAARVKSGVPGLDGLLAGGYPRASTTILEGGTGTGKTLLGLHFLMEGVRAGEPGMLLTLEETPQQIGEIARNFGWDLGAARMKDLLHVLYTPPLELSTDRFLYRAREAVEKSGIRRLVLDSLGALQVGVGSDRRFRELVYALGKHLGALGVTVQLTQEVAELLGSGHLTGHSISSVADNVVRLRYIEAGGRLERAISVLKARGVAHSMELHRFRIGGDGGHVEGPLADLRGTLLGGASADTPRRAPAGKGH